MSMKSFAMSIVLVMSVTGCDWLKENEEEIDKATEDTRSYFNDTIVPFFNDTIVPLFSDEDSEDSEDSEGDKAQ